MSFSQAQISHETGRSETLGLTDRLVPDATVARLLSCSRSTVWRKVREGRLPPPIRIAGLTRWRMSEVEQFIEEAATVRVVKGAALVRGGMQP